mmetsp:Transcript_1885/g.4393  ORF Transcript_1885/g.4393 Transcript_1885/m.4393 type:complete len:104 (-) Transcript_1885:84-395(-)
MMPVYCAGEGNARPLAIAHRNRPTTTSILPQHRRRLCTQRETPDSEMDPSHLKTLHIMFLSPNETLNTSAGRGWAGLSRPAALSEKSWTSSCGGRKIPLGRRS